MSCGGAAVSGEVGQLALVRGHGMDPFLVVGPDSAVKQPGRVERLNLCLEIGVLVGTAVGVRLASFRRDSLLVLVVANGEHLVVVIVGVERGPADARQGVRMAIVPIVVAVVALCGDSKINDRFEA